MAREKLTDKEKQRRKRNRKKKRRDIFIRMLAILMVFVTLAVIIFPVIGPLKELFKGFGTWLAPHTEAAVNWISNTFQQLVAWVQSFF